METSPTLSAGGCVIEHILTPGKTRIQKLNEHGLYPYREMYRVRPVHRKTLRDGGVPGRWPAQQLEGKKPSRTGQKWGE